MKYTKKEAKDWAKHTYRGLENCLLPSFDPSLTRLDERGIRHDVRMSIKHGFFSTCIVSDTCITFDEFVRMGEIAVDEARGKILVSAYVIGDCLETQVKMLKACEAVGMDSVMLGYPPNLQPSSENEIYNVTKDMIDGVNIAINLYPSFKHNFGRFHNATCNPHTWNKLADLDNAVAMKIGVLDWGFAHEAFHLFGDKILVQSPEESHYPMLVSKFGMRWSGPAPYEAYQSPDDPKLVSYFNLLIDGQSDKAMELYWQLTPARQALWSEGMFALLSGVYHYPQWKYQQWLVGGNGGMTRLPCMRIYEHDKMRVRAALQMSGGNIVGTNEEEFYVGRSAYGSLD